MTNRRFRKRLAMILSAAMLTLSMPGYILAEDQQTEIIFDNRNEDVDGTPETEVPEQKPTEPETQMLTLSMPGYILAEDQQTEIIFDNRNEDVDGTPETEVPEQKPTEPETQAPTEPETQAPTEPETQKPTESETQPPTESETQAPIESETQAPTELETQAPTESETQPTEPETQKPTESETQPPTESETQAPIESETQAPTELETQAPTESETQKPSEPMTESEAETESEIEKETEKETEKEKTERETEKETEKEEKVPGFSPSEPMTESEAETESEIEKETEKETEKEKTERETEKETEKEEKVPGFSVDPSAYPAVNITENTLEIYRYLVEKMGLNHAAACGILANIQMESNFNQLAIGDGGTSFGICQWHLSRLSNLKMGLNHAAACGILANIQMESNFNQLAIGDGGTSFGICQWHLSRLSNLMGVCTSLGLDYRTVEGQLVYLEYELNSGYTNVLNYIRSVPNTAQGAYDAAYYWCMYFEMPSQTEARSVQRGNLAMHEYFPQSFNLEKIEKEAYFYETADNVNVRKKPGMEAEVLEVLPKGTTLDVRKKAGEWYCISYKEGEAYVKCEFVKMISSSKENVEKEEMIKQALEENAVFVKKNTQEMQMDLMNQGMELSILKQISRAEAENEKN